MSLNKFNEKFLMKLILAQKFSKMAEYRRLKLNSLHSDQPPA